MSAGFARGRACRGRFWSGGLSNRKRGANHHNRRVLAKEFSCHLVGTSVRRDLTLPGRDSKYYRTKVRMRYSRKDLAMVDKTHPDRSDLGGVMVLCPKCESDLDIEEDEVDEGEIVSCPECGADF